MDKLEDVREVSKANNNILVYDEVQDLFILEAPNADGGTFQMSTESLSGQLITSTTKRVNVLSRRADFLTELGDVVLTNRANDDVLRYNKSDDTYVITPRKLNGGTF